MAADNMSEQASSSSESTPSSILSEASITSGSEAVYSSQTKPPIDRASRRSPCAASATRVTESASWHGACSPSSQQDLDDSRDDGR